MSDYIYSMGGSEGAIERRGVCFVIAAPSGAGKTSVARSLLASDGGLTKSVSVTTRPPRPGERDGTDYRFVDDTQFAAMVAADEFLEWAHVFGRRYGTPRAPVEAALALGRDVIFDIDWQGWRQLKHAMPFDTVGLFILPPSLAVLWERLVKRAGDDAGEIARRMRAARAEITHWREFDHVVVNDGLQECVAEARMVLAGARTASARRTALTRFVTSLLSRNYEGIDRDEASVWPEAPSLDQT